METEETGRRQLATLLATLLIKTPPLKSFTVNQGFYICCSIAVVFLQVVDIFLLELFRSSTEDHHWYLKLFFLKSKFYLHECYFSFKTKMQAYLKTNVDNELVQVCPSLFAFCCFIQSNAKIGKETVNKHPQLLYSTTSCQKTIKKYSTGMISTHETMNCRLL